MDTIFFWCAILGGTVLVCQFVMTLLGMGHGGGDLDAGAPDFGHGGIGHVGDAGSAGHAGHVDHGSTHHDTHDSTSIFKIVSFRTLVAAVTFFGIVGMAGRESGLESSTTLMLALLAGGGAMVGVYYLMRTLTRFDFEGNLRIDRAVDKVGTVYVTIPESNAGAGKIHMQLQNQLVELQAVTRGERLATGATVVVTEVVGPDTVEVALLKPTEIPTHV